MALTRDFKGTIRARLSADPKFRDALLTNGIETMLVGAVDTGKTMLREYIKATIGFDKLGADISTPPKSLIRMFGPTGNLQARNLFTVISHLQRNAGLRLHITMKAQRELPISPTSCTWRDDS